MKDKEFQTHLEFATELAMEAGKVMKQYYRQSILVELKGGNSPVTAADKEINTYIIKKITERFPEHGILGEEESWHPERSELWVCDPIDGTVSFIVHMPLFTFSLAYVVDGVPRVAVVYNPMTDELFSAVRSQGAWLNTVQLHVSDRSWGQHTRLMRRGSPAHKFTLDQPQVASKLHSEGFRLFASQGAVFSGSLIAAGSADGFIFESNTTHDIAALKLIVEEAGGRVTDLRGKEQRYDQPINGAILSNGLIHDELLALVNHTEASKDDTKIHTA